MADDLCPCPKKSTLIEKLSMDGEDWWVCKHQGCELRISGALHYWRAGEHAAIQATQQKSKRPAKAAESDEADDEDSSDEESAEAEAS